MNKSCSTLNCKNIRILQCYNGNIMKRAAKSHPTIHRCVSQIPEQLLITQSSKLKAQSSKLKAQSSPSFAPINQFLPTTHINYSVLRCHIHASINHLRPPLSDDSTGTSSPTALYAVSWARRTARIVCVRGCCRFGHIDYFALARSDCSLFNDDRRVRATAETHFALSLTPHNAFNVEERWGTMV